MTVNSHHLPIADTGDCTEGVTVTVIGVLDDPPVILTITSINPDDSEPTNCPDVNSTSNANCHILLNFCYSMYTVTHLLVLSVITPVAVSLLPAVIAGPSDDGTTNRKSNSSTPSTTSSTITGTLTLLIVIPLANVAVSVVVLKSTSPVSQTFFS